MLWRGIFIAANFTQSDSKFVCFMLVLLQSNGSKLKTRIGGRTRAVSSPSSSLIHPLEDSLPERQAGKIDPEVSLIIFCFGCGAAAAAGQEWAFVGNNLQRPTFDAVIYWDGQRMRAPFTRESLAAVQRDKLHPRKVCSPSVVRLSWNRYRHIKALYWLSVKNCLYLGSFLRNLLRRSADLNYPTLLVYPETFFMYITCDWIVF